jgi:hypothetical protein
MNKKMRWCILNQFWNNEVGCGIANNKVHAMLWTSETSLIDRSSTKNLFKGDEEKEKH